jgi:hypothetical protein
MPLKLSVQAWWWEVEVDGWITAVEARTEVGGNEKWYGTEYVPGPVFGGLPHLIQRKRRIR